MRRWRRPQTARARRGKRLLAAAAALAALAVFCWEWGISSLSEGLTEEVARGYVLEKVTQAVEEELEASPGPYIQVERGPDGAITGSCTDARALHALKAGILERLSHTLNGKATAWVPAGSLTGIAFLNGRGPGLPVRMAFEGSADLRFDTEFTTAGVNQTLHRVTLTVSARAYSQSRRFTASVEESSSAVLAETVVVGPVPQVAVAGAR